jgi:uncharacterized protein (TIGR03437 family)
MRYLTIALISISIAAAQSNSSAPPLTGTHFPETTDLPTLAQLGYNFAVMTVDPSEPSQWKPTLDAAQAAGLQLIVGGYPPPYTESNGVWSISSQGQQLLNYLASRSSQVMAVYVFNEPYYTNPANGNQYVCGYYSASDLRSLRTAIQGVWPGAKIYQDIGWPSDWAPGSSYVAENPCVGTKYADQTNVADYVGIWYYPFTGFGDSASSGISQLTTEVSWIANNMQPAVAVSLNQSYACANCAAGGYVFPTASEIYQWNCATRNIPLGAVSWYPWRLFSSYTEAIATVPALWPLTTAASCDSGMGSSVVGLSSASGQPFVAPDSFVSLYGSSLAAAIAPAAADPLPLSLSGVSLQVTDSGGNALDAALSYVSPQLINFVMPSTAAPGQAAISVSTGVGLPQLGTAIIQNVAPALFSADGTGTGVAAAVALGVTGSQQTMTPAFQCTTSGTGSACTPTPINLSSATSVYVILYGTGIRHYQNSVLCSINGTSQPVQFAGAQTTYQGLDQVNVGPVTGLQGTGVVNVYLIVDGYSSNVLSLQFQ